MPSLDPNAMDTRADRSRSFNKNRRTQGRAANVTADATETQRKEGRCFTCNKQGHISRNCPDKKKKDKALVKARKAETEDSGAEGDGEKSEEEEPISPEAFVRLGKTMKEKDKIAIIKAAIEAEQGKEGPDADF
jgi:hypothetical protein